MNSNKKRIILLVASIILLNFIPHFLSCYLVNWLTKKLKKRYNLFFRIENPGLRGIKKFTFKSVYIKTDKFKIILKNGVITINLYSLIYKKSFREIVEIFDLREVFFLAFSSKAKKGIRRNPEANDRFCFEKMYYSLYRKSIEKFWDLRFTGNITRIIVISSFHNKKVSLFLKDLDMFENSITGYAEVGIKDYWVKAPFKLYKDRDECKIEISNQNLSQNLATISGKNNHLFSFSEYKITYKETDNSNYTISGEIFDILISNPSISLNQVLIKKLELEQLIRFTENEFGILKESSLNFDGIASFMEFHHCCSESDLLRMSVIFFLEGQDFLQKFPFLSMQNIRCLQVSGDTALKLDYMTSLADFSSYYFNSQILQNTLQIEKSHEFDISYLSSDFIHYVNNLSGTVRGINISNTNKNFLSINEISPNLRNVIIATEDPNFYKHKGIDSYFVGIAIAKNIVNKKYVKGASTITMQLAKNLFLTKTKTPSRKFEEVVLAWLMENYFNISKNRILEIYLNIIEFGENIYGLSEAARYYFDKKVSELDITESLVLSYIIPRPKYFLEALLIKSQKLIQNLTKHIDFYSNDLLNRQLIDEESYNEVKYNIKFSPSIGTLVLK
jgi:hypothetical protein